MLLRPAKLDYPPLECPRGRGCNSPMAPQQVDGTSQWEATSLTECLCADLTGSQCKSLPSLYDVSLLHSPPALAGHIITQQLPEGTRRDWRTKVKPLKLITGQTGDFLKLLSRLDPLDGHIE